MGGDVRVMGHHHDRMPPLVDQPAEQSRHLAAIGGVEIARRFVGQQQRRLDHQRPATATRCCSPPESLLGRCVRRGSMPTVPSTASARALAAGVGVPPSSSGRATFSSALSVGRRLNDWKMKPIRRRRRIVRSSRQRGQIGAFQQHLAAVRAIDTAQEVQQCALARTRGAHDRQEFALFDRQVDSAQRLDAQPPLPYDFFRARASKRSIVYSPSWGIIFPRDNA